MRRSALLAIAVLALAGCSSTTPAAKDPTMAPTTVAQDATALAGPLKAGLASVTKIVTITEDNDPNDDIGRPGGYTSAAVIYDKNVKCEGKDVVVGCGAKIEVFESAAAAKARAAYIQGLMKSMPILGKEYDYLRGVALLRIAGEVKPSLAKQYNAAFGGVPVAKPSATTPTADPADAALRTAVQAYSDAYLSGDAKAAYALLSDRCQKRYTLDGFSLLVSQAKTLYGNPLPMTSYKAHIADGMARVTYTYTIAGINQTDQPWTLAGSGWRDDNC